jgi:hypothetical protein
MGNIEEAKNMRRINPRHEMHRLVIHWFAFWICRSGLCSFGFCVGLAQFGALRKVPGV